MNAAALAAWQAKCPPEQEVADMPHISQMMQSKYLTKEDCANKPVVTIRTVQPEQFGGRAGQSADTRWILYFNEARKGLKLNSTTIKVLAAAFGENSEAWVGKRVMLYVDQTVMMAGQVVGGIRIQPPRTAPTEVGFQPSGAFSAAAWEAPRPAAPAAVDTRTGEIKPATTAAVDPEFDDPVPF